MINSHERHSHVRFNGLAYTTSDVRFRVARGVPWFGGTAFVDGYDASRKAIVSPKDEGRAVTIIDKPVIVKALDDVGTLRTILVGDAGAPTKEVVVVVSDRNALGGTRTPLVDSLIAIQEKRARRNKLAAAARCLVVAELCAASKGVARDEDEDVQRAETMLAEAAHVYHTSGASSR